MPILGSAPVMSQIAQNPPAQPNRYNYPTQAAYAQAIAQWQAEKSAWANSLSTEQSNEARLAEQKRASMASESQSSAQLAEQKRQFDAAQAARQQALQGILAGISSASSRGTTTGSATVGGGTTSAPSGGGGASTFQPYQDTADRQAYARAKDNTGMALNSALKGLQATMASRGITGSGVEGTATANLYAKGLDTVANVDAGLSRTSAEHAFADTEQSKSIGEQGREFDVGQATDVSKFNAGLAADSQSKRLSAIMQAYGSLY